MRKLKVVVDRGVDLVSMDPNGYSDPFVQISHYCQARKKDLLVKKVKTKVLKKTLDPEFNESFVFEVSQNTDVIEFSVFDWDAITGNDKMGIYVLKLDSVSKLVIQEGVILDLKLEKVKKGTLRVHLSFEDVKGDEDWKIKIDEGKLIWTVLEGKKVTSSSSGYNKDEFSTVFVCRENGSLYGGSEPHKKDDDQCTVIAETLHGKLDRKTGDVEFEIVSYVDQQFWYSKKGTGSFKKDWNLFIGNFVVTRVSEHQDSFEGQIDYKYQVGDECKCITNSSKFSFVDPESAEELMKRSQCLFDM